MSKRSRNYFFQSNPTSSGKRLRQYNKPDEMLYRNLLDSMPFFDEVGDTAGEGAQGLVKLATNANAIARTSASATSMQTVVRPHQLPFMVGADGTVAGTIDTAVEKGGLKLTPKDNAGSTGMDFQIEMDPSNLSTVTFVPATDKVLINDATDNTPKLADISAFLIGAVLWERAAGILSPVNAGDDLDLDYGDIHAGDFVFDNNSARSMVVEITTDGDGKDLTIAAGASSYVAANSDGGNLLLYSGKGAGEGVAGDIYITATEAGGDVMLGWGGAAAFGTIGIGCAAIASMAAKIGGDAELTGTLQIDTPSTDAIITLIGLDASNQIQSNTVPVFQTKLFGTGVKGDILYHDGTEWKRLAAAGAAHFLKFDFGVSDVPVWAAVSGAAGDELVAVDAVAAPGYLYSGGSGVLRPTIQGGIEFTDAGNYISLAMDISNLDTPSISPDDINSRSYMAITDINQSDRTVKIPMAYVNSGKDSNWAYLVPGTDYTETPSSTSRIATIDLTNYYAKGMSVRFKLDSDTSYRYAVIDDITATYIDIKGDPLVVAADELEGLWIGGYDRVCTESILFGPIANYNANTITTVLDTFSIRTGGFQWLKPDAKLVYFSVINKSDDGTVDPIVNLRIGATVTDYISTSNTNKGLLVTTTLNETGIDIITTKNTAAYGDLIEVKVDKNGGTGDADDIQIMATFVYMSNEISAP